MEKPTVATDILHHGPGEGPRVLAAAVGVTLALAMLVFWPWALDQFSLPKTLLLLAANAILAAWAVVLAAARRAPGGSRALPGVLAAAAVLWLVLVPALRAPNLELHLTGALFLLAWSGGVLAAAVSRRWGGRPALRRIFLGVGAGGVAVAVFAVLQGAGLDPVRLFLGLHPRGPGRWRILTSMGNPGWTAETVAVTAPAVLTLVLDSGRRRVRRWGGLVVVVLLAAAVAWTGSRTGALGLAAGLAVLLWLRAGATAPRRRAAVAGAAVLLLVLALSAAVGMWRWGEVRPLTGRLGLWSAGVHLVSQRPLDGWGLLHTRRVLPAGLAGVVRAAPPRVRSLLPRLVVDRLDNDWLQFALEGGIPAAVLVLGVLGAALARSWRLATERRVAAGAAVAASLVVLGLLSLVSGPLHTPATAAVFWVFVGLAAVDGPGGEERPASPVPRLTHVVWLLPLAAVACSVMLFRADVGAGHGRRAAGTDRPGEAIRLLGPVVPRLGWLAPGWTALARAELDSGQPERALDVVRRARRWTAGGHLWAVEIRALEALGRREDARRVLEAALSVLPGSPVLLKLRPGIEGDGKTRDVGSVQGLHGTSHRSQ